MTKSATQHPPRMLPLKSVLGLALSSVTFLVRNIGVLLPAYVIPGLAIRLFLFLQSWNTLEAAAPSVFLHWLRYAVLNVAGATIFVSAVRYVLRDERPTLLPKKESMQAVAVVSAVWLISDIVLDIIADRHTLFSFYLKHIQADHEADQQVYAVIGYWDFFVRTLWASFSYPFLAVLAGFGKARLPFVLRWHRHNFLSIFLFAAVLGAAVGTIDEVYINSILPDSLWHIPSSAWEHRHLLLFTRQVLLLPTSILGNLLYPVATAILVRGLLGDEKRVWLADQRQNAE